MSNNLSGDAPRFALVAHDARKVDLAGPGCNLSEKRARGGDQQIGAMISEVKWDALIGFVDPLSLPAI
jgi:methylglyoxal synthase